MMKRFAKQTVEKGVEGLMEEFDTLPKRLQKNIPEHKYFDHNMDKNIYKDIYCIDSTRVKLTWPPGSKDDYIHANWIRGFPELTKSIIATQAPKEQSIGDFWRMVWQEKVAVIVMLCQLVENNKKKADLYWPYDQNQSFENSGLKITTMASRMSPTSR